ncbi:patatin-like phospholipase family protein [Archangium sp.]|uniref:patatin-like phospholipase family protein n=1 Tax=Archangium sp. TaxID=1872627 RepID=UPI002D4C931E|nr:patatin-like phospholipase family protein [Archangium sp.]HYO53319.1 patatin-like phospholipase family protein [Archangium sp.]
MSHPPDSSPSKRFRTISFDGGPSTPLMLRIIQLLEIQFPGFIEKADMFSGTSDGAFASLYLARALGRGQDGQNVIKECIEFHDKVVKNFTLSLTGVLRMGFFGLLSMYDGSALEEVLRSAFGDDQLQQLNRKISIEAYNSRVRQTTTFHQANAPKMLLVEAALASAAFMPMLPAFRRVLSDEERGNWAPDNVDSRERADLMFDGAFASNSPILAALLDASHFLWVGNGNGDDTQGNEPPLADEGSLQRISMLSMGCNVQGSEFLGKIFSIKWPPFGLQDRPYLFEYGPLWSLISGAQGLLSTLIQREATDESRFVMKLLGSQRFYRFAPGDAGVFTVFDIMCDPEEALERAWRMADKIWVGDEGDKLREWVANYWMKQPSMSATAPVRGTAATG